MGYCYRAGKLCCDICGHPGARKNRCPSGYCQPVACCTRPACKEKLAHYRKTTCATECKRLHTEFMASEQEKQRRLDQGDFIRDAAVSMDKPFQCVKVWFRNGQGETLIRYMTRELYRSFSLDDHVSPEEFRIKGELHEQPF